MASNIDLGSFQFDAGKVDQTLSELREQMFQLRNESKKYADESRENEKQLKKLAEVQQLIANTGGKSSKVYKENAEEINKLNARQKELFVNQTKVKDNQKEVNKEYREAVKMSKSLADAEGNRVSSQEALNTALNNEVKTIADARASNKELLELRNNLDIAGGKNQDVLEALNKALNDNNAFIKENVSEYEQQKIGIGDYQTAIENALGGTKLFGVGLNEVKSTMSQFSGILDLLKRELAQATAGMAANKKAAEGMGGAQKMAFITSQTLTTGLKLLRLALISTGIGAIVVALGSLIAYLSTTQAGIDAVTSVTRPLTVVFQTLLGVVQKFGGELFDDPIGKLKEMRDFVVKQLVESFTGLGKIIAGIFTFDGDKIKEGANQIKKLADDNAQALKDFAKGIGDQFDEAWQKGKRIDELQKEIERKEIDMIAYRATAESQLKEQENIIKNQLLSAEERNKAIQEAERISKELVARENEILDAQIEQLKIKQSLNDTSREDEAELQKLIAARISSGDKILEVERKSLGARRQLNNEAVAAAKQRQDEAIKRNQDLLALFQAEQGFNKKSAEEELRIAEQVRDKKIAILEQELKYKKISEVEYNTQLLQINDEFLKLQTEQAIANAERERDIALKGIEERKNDLEAYSEARLELEKQNAQDKFEVEQEYFQLQLEQGVINQQEYDDAIAEAKVEAREAEAEAQAVFDQAQKDKALIDLENERLIEEQQYNDRFELQKARLEQQRLAEVANAEKTGADIALINAKYAEYQKKIEEQKQEHKLNQAKAVFNGISELLGKESAAGKAAAIAASIINTAQGVTKALAEGGVLGIATGALVAATGAISIAKIAKEKPPQRPKAERGMRVPERGTVLSGASHRRGGIHIEAEGGEAIINKRSTAMFPELISAINVAGGGIPLAAKGMIAGGVSKNSAIQNRLLADSFNEAMADTIGQAVREGSMEGSAQGSQLGAQTGIIGLSENREVQRNSAF